MQNIYFFHWPSDLGGADTRLKELIQCFNLSQKYNLFCIPNDEFRLKEDHNIRFLKDNNVKTLFWNELPQKTSGYAIAFCNFRLFSENWRVKKIKNMGLKLIWSNDMMWTTNQEIECLQNNLISTHIYTSKFHKHILEKKQPELTNHKSFIVPNYFHFQNYKKIEKKNYLKDKFVIGKLSRADEMKFSENFPLFYQKMNIENPKFRIMGWSEQLSNKFKWFDFKNGNWDLLPENSEGIIEFLSQLDLYVFNAHHNYIENQTRAMIEAQLIGVPGLAPNYGNFPNIIWHGKNGFIYNTIEECYEYINLLQKDKILYQELSNNSISLSKTIWANPQNQLNYWEFIFENI